MDLTDAFVELVRRCAASLPPDVEARIAEARDREEGTARSAMTTILENIALARERSVPMCQDTGATIFWVHYPAGMSQLALERQATAAVRKASALTYLRPNAVDSVTGKNSGDNTGAGVPTFHFHEWEEPYLKVELMLKGGGSENVSAQVKLPDASLGAGRNLEGVRRAVVDVIFKAQGQGCAPGVIGVGVGGNRDTGFEAAKHALMQPLDQKNADPQLAELEDRLYDDLNELGIGPMGFGGRTTVLGVKVAALHRLPACYFVSVAYVCWACRRNTLTVRDGEVSYDH